MAINHLLRELQQLISFPTISGDPRYLPAMHDCAGWLQQQLLAAGIQRAVKYALPGNGPPVVYAAHITRPGLPTVLFYGHYDVQPAGPASQWRYPPFGGIIRNGYLHGRGASDDKGQFYIHIKAVAQLLKEKGRLPLNVKFLLEGEEEGGSPGLPAFIDRYPQLLQCDVAVISDTKMQDGHLPAITSALRGALNMEVEIYGPEKELHSGIYGGAVHNPAQLAAWLVTRLFTPQQRIAIPGFYKMVTDVPARQENFPDARLLEQAGTRAAWGERPWSLYERTTVRPSLTVTGISSGYTKQGFKNAIPVNAIIKLNFRLVPRQRPAIVAQQVRAYLRQLIPAGFHYRIHTAGHAIPMAMPPGNRYVQAAVRAYAKTFGAPVQYLRSGGTIPIAGILQQQLHRPVVLMGFGQDSDRIHATNERFSLAVFFRGIRTSMAFMEEVARLNK